MNRLFPARADNAFQGHRIALWLFAMAVLMRIVVGVNTIFIGRRVLTTADGIPLDTYPPAAAQTILSIAALRGLSLLIICLICIVVLVRYRSLVPMMFGVLLVEMLSRRLIFQFLPIPRSGQPSGMWVNEALLVATVIGMILALWTRRPREQVQPLQ